LDYVATIKNPEKQNQRRGTTEQDLIEDFYEDQLLEDAAKPCHQSIDAIDE